MIGREEIVAAVRAAIEPLEACPLLRPEDRIDYARTFYLSCVLNPGWEGKSGDENVAIVPLSKESPSWKLLEQAGQLYQQGRGDEFPWEDHPQGIPHFALYVWEPNESISFPNALPMLCMLTGWDSGHDVDADGKLVKECTNVSWARTKEPEYAIAKGSNVSMHFFTCAIVTHNQGG